MVLIEELRIGNLIYGVSDRVEIVCGIIEDQIKSKPYLSMFDENWTDIKHISYVPLTEKWLWKFGFEIKYGNTFFKDKLKFDINTIGLVRFHWSQKVTYVKYVHQLQNLYFALTGEELTLKSND